MFSYSFLILFFSNGFTLQEALDILFDVENENQSQVEQIFIGPPELNVLTDEDSGDEDGADAVDNLSGRQLLAPAIGKCFQQFR